MQRPETDQPLPLPDLVVPESAPTAEERFEAFAAANPHVEALLVRFARELRAEGHTRVPFRMLWEDIRLKYARQTKGDSYARLNNNHAPFYSRRIMATYDDLAGLFETRGRKREDEAA